MNKKFKIASVAVSAIMAGSMMVGMVGCTKSGGGGGNKAETPLDYAPGEVTLKMNIGDDARRSISFQNGNLIAGTIKLPDGKEYTSSDLKPTWKALQDQLGIKFEDVWISDSKKVENAITSQSSATNIANMDIITDGATNIVTNSKYLLNLNDYLDYMPHYKAFLEDHESIRLSLTSGTSTGAMYYAPYFDGNNDIEKYALFKTNWVKSLLDTDGGDTSMTYAIHGMIKQGNGNDFKNTKATKTAITSYMGTTGNWNVPALDKDGKVLSGGITVDYGKVLDTIKVTTSGIGQVYADANDGKAYDGTSGNIVDIMNKLIDAHDGEVTGATLVKLLREYIKVAYYNGNTPIYTQDGYKLSDVFCGYSAAWDVDLYAALGRALVTNPSLIKSGSGTIKTTGNTGSDGTALSDLYLVAARSKDNMQRISDTLAFAAQLYGVRGLESKNFYAYVDANGSISDPRNQEASYDAYNLFHNFWLEGLVYTGASGDNGDQSWAKSGTCEALSSYDYVNTQTPVGFQVDGYVTGMYDGVEDGYYYTPVITPVSKWNDSKDADAEGTKMRFTESWRTTKDTGFCVPVANVTGSEANRKKLKAVLNFIDFMFTPTGQILMTYGPMASSADSKDGFWYNAEATAEQIAANQYFEFNDKKYYSTEYYNKAYQPIITENVMNAYYGLSTSDGFAFNGQGSYAGTQMPVPDPARDKVNKNSDLTDTYCVKADGTYELIYTVPSDICYVVTHTDGKKYLVDKTGWPLGAQGKLIASSSANMFTEDVSLNYTDFARFIIGSTLPIGSKLQSFEYQLTSKMGKDGAHIVDKALEEGVILHTVNDMTEDNYWYTVIPTILPYDSQGSTQLTNNYAMYSTGNADTYFTNNSGKRTNLYWDIVKYGYEGGSNFKYDGITLSKTTSAKEIIEQLKGFNAYLFIKQKAWNSSKGYYESKLKK